MMCRFANGLIPWLVRGSEYRSYIRRDSRYANAKARACCKIGYHSVYVCEQPAPRIKDSRD